MIHNLKQQGHLEHLAKLIKLPLKRYKLHYCTTYKIPSLLLKITVLLKMDLWWSQQKKPKFTKRVLHVTTRHRKSSKLFKVYLSLGIMCLQGYADTCIFLSFFFFLFKKLTVLDFSKVKSHKVWTAIEISVGLLLKQSHWTDTDGNWWKMLKVFKLSATLSYQKIRCGLCRFLFLIYLYLTLQLLC